MRVQGGSCAPEAPFPKFRRREILSRGCALLMLFHAHTRPAGKRRWLQAAELHSVLLGLLLTALPGRAQELVFRLQPAQSRVQFTLPATLHTVHGTFQVKSGNIQFNPATGQASGAVVVDATSGNTGNSDRDRRMHQQILEDQQYPEITFTPQRISGALAPEGTSEIQLQGLMTLHGQQHPISLTASVTVNHGGVSAEVHFIVPYLQWGLKNPSTFLLRVSHSVEVEVHAAGHIAPYSSAGSGNGEGSSPRF